MANSSISKKCYKRSPWSESDKWTLLRALRKFGYDNLDRIADEFPTKSKPAVKTMINKLRSSAEKNAPKKETRIDQWLNSNLFPENDTTVPEALKYISMFEQHPPPEECADCDFQALYDLLSKVSLGHPPKSTTDMTYKTLFNVMRRVTSEVWPPHEREIYDYVDRVLDRKIFKTYPPQKKRNAN